MKNLVLSSLILSLLLFQHFEANAQGEARLLRFPTLHGNQLVFSYAGDLYTVSASGGMARKLTSDAGYEMFSHFSPDGKAIAFTAQYDGNTEIYTMPAEGGGLRRVTMNCRSCSISPSRWWSTNRASRGSALNGSMIPRRSMYMSIRGRCSKYS